jgi:hypothetical protein
LGTEHYRQWLFGFLSGLNASRLRSHEKPFDLMDEDAQWRWVVGICQTKPQMTLFAAAAGLWNQLEAGRPPRPAQPFFPTSERARIVIPETTFVLVVVEDAKHMGWFDLGPGGAWEFLGPYSKEFERPSISREGCKFLIDWGHKRSPLLFDACVCFDVERPKFASCRAPDSQLQRTEPD